MKGIQWAKNRSGHRWFVVVSVVCGLSVFFGGCSGSKSNQVSNTQATVNNSSQKNNGNQDKSDPARSGPSDGEVPQNEEVQELVKATLLDFNEAVQDGDFSDFYDSISKEWQNQTSPGEFEEAFSEFVQKGVDISPISALDAEFSPEPRVDQDQGRDVLMLEGSYATVPAKTRFVLKYIPENGDWKLTRIRVVVK